MKKYSLALKKTFSHYPEIKLVYFFGSKAKNKASILSDYDFAVYFDKKISISQIKEITLSLIAKISSILKSDNIDLVILNQSLSPILKFNIIKEGKLIYEKPPYKLLVEPLIYNEYFDFKVFIQSLFNK